MLRFAIFVTVFFASSALAADNRQSYPNIDGEVLLEDDRVVVQRFVLQPGQWEGIHAHPQHQLVVVLRSSSEVTARFGDTERVFENADGADRPMHAFWRPAVALTEQHESGNTGDTPLEWIAITFKSESIATPQTPTWDSIR